MIIETKQLNISNELKRKVELICRFAKGVFMGKIKDIFKQFNLNKNNEESKVVSFV